MQKLNKLFGKRLKRLIADLWATGYDRYDLERYVAGEVQLRLCVTALGEWCSGKKAKRAALRGGGR